MAAIELDGEVRDPGSVTASPGPIATVLVNAHPSEAATHATVVSTDGYRASIPLGTLSDGGMLTTEDGGLRLRVLDGDTLCWNVKDVVRIEVSIGKLPDDVPEKPRH